MNSVNSKSIDSSGISFSRNQMVLFLLIANLSFVLGIFLGYFIDVQIKKNTAMPIASPTFPIEIAKDTSR